MSENLFNYAELESSKEVVVGNANNAEQKDNGVSTFENVTFGKVRAIIQNGEPLFCLSDICKVLELTSPHKVKDAIVAEFEGVELNSYPLETAGGRQNFTFINESEMYFVLMRSRSDRAKPFRQWVTKEVLPSIRKTGSYSVAPKLPQTYAEALRELADKVEENERLLIENADQKEIINSYKIADRTKRNKQELATLLNRKIRELADKHYARQYARCYNEVYAEFAKLHCFTHKVDMQFLRTNIDYLSECLKLVLDLLDKE